MYLLYLKVDANEFMNEVRYLVPRKNIELEKISHNKVRFIYAWSDSKKQVKKFFQLRDKNKYDVVKEDDDMCDYYYDTLPESALCDSKLLTGVYSDRHEEEYIDVVMTGFERTSIDEESDLLFYEYAKGIFGQESDLNCDYVFLKNKYIKALTALSYCQLYDVYISCDDGRNDRGNFDESYGISDNLVCRTKRVHKSVLSQITSQLTVFIMVYNFAC